MDERLQQLKQDAWDDRDLDLFEFYNGIEYELKRLGAVGQLVARFYKRGGITDEGWNTLFEALFDAGLLNEEQGQESETPNITKAEAETLFPDTPFDELTRLH